jgi:hypothetical protein
MYILYIIKLYYFNLEFLKKNCIRPSYTYSNQKYFMNGLQLNAGKTTFTGSVNTSQVQSVLFMYMYM